MGAGQRGQQGGLLGRPVVDVHHVVEGCLKEDKLAKEHCGGDRERRQVSEQLFQCDACHMETVPGCCGSKTSIGLYAARGRWPPTGGRNHKEESSGIISQPAAVPATRPSRRWRDQVSVHRLTQILRNINTKRGINTSNQIQRARFFGNYMLSPSNLPCITTSS